MSGIAENRSARKWTLRELAGRILWGITRPLFRYSPRVCWGWRCWLLRRFGARVGREVRIDPSATIFIPWNLAIDDWSSIGFDALVYNLGPLRIGKRVTISQRSHLCGGTHDYRDAAMPLVKASIVIGDDAWVCADAFVGPGINVGCGAVIAARAVVAKDVAAWTVVAGNPAAYVKDRPVTEGCSD